MTTAHDIERSLYDWAPRELAMAWDNVGLLVGDPACNLHLPTAVGALRPTALAQPSMVAGDAVVLDPPDTLEDGARVRLAEDTEE